MPTLTCVTTSEADVLPASIPSQQKIASQEVVPTQTSEHAPYHIVPLPSPTVPPPYHSEHAKSQPDCSVPTTLPCDVPTQVHVPTLTSADDSHTHSPASNHSEQTNVSPDVSVPTLTCVNSPGTDEQFMPTLTCVTTPEADVLPTSIPSE